MIIASFFFTFSILICFGSRREQEVVVHPPVQEIPIPPSNPGPKQPRITNPFPGYQNYQSVINQLKEWESEAEDFVDIGTYGTSSNGTPLWWIRITNEKDSYYNKKKVLVTASIHGNEPWSTSTVMAYIGTILDTYGKDHEVTSLVESRELYFIPVVSPDSYPVSRRVDGVDPNRDFPTLRNPNKTSVPPVQALRNFFLKVQPNAVISGHTYGRLYLYPWGDQRALPSNNEDFQRIVGEMGFKSRYKVIRACEMYNRPIYGTELDWYYRNGAFPVVMEFGTHQRIPSMEDTKIEFERTYKAVLYFLKEAPLVEMKLD